jgi:hypothetical protein
MNIFNIQAHIFYNISPFSPQRWGFNGDNNYRSHLKIKILVQNQGGAEFGPKDYFGIASSESLSGGIDGSGIICTDWMRNLFFRISTFLFFKPLIFEIDRG